MPWTLAEFSKIETDPLRKSIIDSFIINSPIMEAVPWETIAALTTGIVRVQDLPSVGFRKINAGFAESTGHFEQATESVALMGGYIDTDKAIARAKNAIADVRAIQQNLMMKAMSFKFNDKFFNGDRTSDPEEFTGIKKRIDDLNADGYTDQYINNEGTSGDGILLDSTERHNFLDHLDELVFAIRGHKPDALYMNSKTLLALRSLLRREQLLTTIKDSFDRVIDMYQNIPLIDIGTKADQVTQIITNTETLEAAGAAESTSIYAVKYGIGEYLWGIQEYPLEVEDKGLLEATPVYRTEIDWPLGLALIDTKSVARLCGIIPNNST